MSNIRKIIFILLCIIFSTGCGKQEKGLLLSGEDTVLGVEAQEEAADSSAVNDGGSDPDGKNHSESIPMIYVQVSGAVNSPGVYALPEGSRIFEAVELAGGVTEEADLHSLNQARVLTDGEMIWVMTVTEAAEEGNLAGGAGKEEASRDDGRVNLNTATKEELMELPGIGAAKADSILAWREDNGSFTQIEDLMKIEGIKEGVFSKIEDYVKVQ